MNFHLLFSYSLIAFIKAWLCVRCQPEMQIHGAKEVWGSWSDLVFSKLCVVHVLRHCQLHVSQLYQQLDKPYTNAS